MCLDSSTCYRYVSPSEKARPALLDVVAVGRHSKVLRAVSRRPDLPNYIAVKCIPKPSNTSSEIANHAKVSDHERILTLFGSYEDEHALCMQLELAECNLFAAINERSLFQSNPGLIRPALLQIIDAVHYCHEQSVFHGDIKPSSILYKGDSDGFKLLLCDFRASTSSPTATGTGCGRESEMYTSPERLGEEFTLPAYSMKQSDTWSIGIVAFNIICARGPWEKAASSSSSFNRYLHSPDYLSAMAGISKECQGILKRILTLNPLARISLPNLRAEIATLPSFFIAEEDVVENSPPLAQYTGRNSPPLALYYRLPMIPKMIKPATSQSSDSSKSSMDTVTDADDRIIYPSPALAYEPLREHEAEPIVEEIAKSLIISSDCDGHSSDEESEGPITPSSAAVKVDLDVPHLNLGSSLLSPPKHVGGRFRSASWAGRKPMRQEYEHSRAVSGRTIFEFDFP